MSLIVVCAALIFGAVLVFVMFKMTGRIIALSSQLAVKEAHCTELERRIGEERTMRDTDVTRMQTEFENIANRLLDEKGKRMVELHQEKANAILEPLRMKIDDFKAQVVKTYETNIKERAALKFELDKLATMNKQLSDEANNLTDALKGDKKLQGCWGEETVERLLDWAGLAKDIHFKRETEFIDNGDKQRPDFIICLPDNKHIIVDSKVSLNAYSDYFAATTEDSRAKSLKEHVKAIQTHIALLSAKRYEKLYTGITQPDYILMFMPIEPALSLAFSEDKELFETALKKNIVLVTTSTLLATLRTISYIWKQDDQKKNVLEIAREGGALYDKFVGFAEDLIKVGEQIDKTKETHLAAMNKLKDSPKKGDTVIGRIERLRSLGANTSKTLPISLSVD